MFFTITVPSSKLVKLFGENKEIYVLGVCDATGSKKHICRQPYMDLSTWNFVLGTRP